MEGVLCVRVIIQQSSTKHPTYFSLRSQEIKMNNNVFEGKWKQMRGQAKLWWGKLTDDDLEKVGGQYDKLIGLLQEKYGYSQQQAEDEYKKRTS
jgi:uncharacterized protein YjbJ (UPF0337 family)